MKSFVLIFILFFGIARFAQAKKHQHHQQAHVHGAGTLGIAFDGTVGKIEFRGAAEGILGFEYKPKNKNDEKTVADAIENFENNMGQMVAFDETLNCKLTKETIGQVPEKGEKHLAEHSEWVANFKVNCIRSPLGTKMTVDFTRFKHLKDLDITVLVDSLQKTAEFNKKPVTINLGL